MDTKPIIGIYGLDGDTRIDVSEEYAHFGAGRFIKVPQPYLIEAASLGEALNTLTRFLKLSFEPFAGDEHFVFETLGAVETCSCTGKLSQPIARIARHNA
jgi:hypothetical protein